MENETINFNELKKVEASFKCSDGSIRKLLILVNPDETQEDWKFCLDMIAESSDSELITFEVIK